MEMTTLNLMFENEVNLEIVSKIIDNDKSFLYSLMKLKGCNKLPNCLEIKLGILKKEEE